MNKRFPGLPREVGKGGFLPNPLFSGGPENLKAGGSDEKYKD
jgi:hypothetical protein